MQVATSLTLLQETMIQPPTEVVRVNGGKFSGKKNIIVGNLMAAVK